MSKHNTNYASVKNYILLGNTMDTLKSQAKNIANQVRISCPAAFNAEKSGIAYVMKYIPPFDKHFDLLFRLQGIAAEEARFQDEYRGYILVDVSEYLQHEKEEWFDISLKFLHDRNELWKYIFLVDMNNVRAGNDMVAKILSLMYCRVQDLRETDDCMQKRFIREQCKALELPCDSGAYRLLEALAKEYPNDSLRTFLAELADRLGGEEKITAAMIRECAESADSVMRYTLPPTAYARFVKLVEDYLQKGSDYDEKL